MKTINENTKNAFKEPTTKRKGVILVNGNYYDVYNVEYYADCYDEGNVIGNAIASQLDFDIPYMEKFDTFQYYDCIYADDTYQYIDFGTFTVFDEKDEDEFNKHITAFDKLIKFNAPFEDVGGYPKTLYAELLNVCTQAGVTLGVNSIPNGSFVVTNNQFTEGKSLKTVLKNICGISGTYAVIKNNNLYLQLKNITTEEIDKSQHEPVDWKRRSYGINQVIIGDSTIEGEYVIKQDDADIALNGVHKLEILNNLFANTQEKRTALINELYNQVHGFGYIPFEMNGEWLSYLEIGDTINIDGIDTILLRINAKSPEALETTISAPAIIDSSIDYVDNTNDINNQMQRTERSVDKQNQIITDVVTNVTEQNDKISRIEQTVDEINSKISDVADITKSAEDTDAQVELQDINQSEPVQLKIHPIITNISYDYPHQDYPQNDYCSIRTIRFHNTETNEDFDYELPEDLLYYDGDNYDEFLLDYGDGEQTQICRVTKKCKWNADGSVGLLTTPETHNYEYPAGEHAINLTDGDYVVSILTQSNGYLFVRLMAKNIYTTQFYTKAQVDSQISQTAQSIELGVNQTLTNYATTSDMRAAINVSANAITTGVSSTYETKLDATGKLNTSKSYADGKASAAERNAKKYTDDELENYSTTVQMNTSIDQKILDNNNAYVNIEVAKKVDNEDFTGANIMLEINNDESGAIINANKISLAGKTINMTSDNVAINSNNFSVDTSGHVTASSMDITGGSIDFTTSLGRVQVGKGSGGLIVMNGTLAGNTYDAIYGAGGWNFKKNGNYIARLAASTTSASNPTNPYFRLSDDYGAEKVAMKVVNSEGKLIVNDANDSGSFQVHGNYAEIYNSSGYTTIDFIGEYGYVDAAAFRNTSLAKSKKNIEKFENALEEIKNTDIYKYHFKNEDEKNKKHLGFVIGEGYNYPKSATTYDKDGNPNGADAYALASLCLQAIKEQQIIIENLQNKIDKLERESEK